MEIEYADLKFETKAQVTKVEIPSRLITSHIRNADGKTPTLGETTNVTIWESSSLPLYEDNSDVFVSGSLCPVGLDITSPSPTLEVIFNITNEELVGVPLWIYGDNDTAECVMVMLSDEPVAFNRVGESPAVKIKVSPRWASLNVPWGVAGNISWRFCVARTKARTKAVLGLNSSRLELYAFSMEINRLIDSMVPVTLLRRFILPRTIWPAGYSWERYCCSVAFYDLALKYEARKGGTDLTHLYPGLKRVEFKLGKFLPKLIGEPTEVNCYDQACLLAVTLTLCPTTNSIDWLFMTPFGFIKPTILIGQSVCNNPFFNGEDEHRQPYSAKPFCDSRGDYRSGFGNHAFVRVNSATREKIVDACAGPHFGNETLDQYLTASIDQVPGYISGEAGGELECKLTVDTKGPTITLPPQV